MTVCACVCVCVSAWTDVYHFTLAIVVYLPLCVCVCVCTCVFVCLVLHCSHQGYHNVKIQRSWTDCEQPQHIHDVFYPKKSTAHKQLAILTRRLTMETKENNTRKKTQTLCYPSYFTKNRLRRSQPIPGMAPGATGLGRFGAVLLHLVLKKGTSRAQDCIKASHRPPK